MMIKKQKYLLYLGMVNIWAGVILRIVGLDVPSPAIFFALGGSLKVTYLLLTMRREGVKPGVEFLFLASGVIALIFGIHSVRIHQDVILGIALIVTAAVLKITFLVMAIRKLRRAKLKPAQITIPVSK